MGGDGRRGKMLPLSRRRRSSVSPVCLQHSSFMHRFYSQCECYWGNSNTKSFKISVLSPPCTLPLTIAQGGLLMGQPRWSQSASIEKWGQLTESAFIYSKYNSSNNSISLILHVWKWRHRKAQCAEAGSTSWAAGICPPLSRSLF